MNLWPVEHFCLHFFPDQHWSGADLEKKWRQKCSTGQRFTCTEVTSYKIHTLEQFFFHSIVRTIFRNKIPLKVDLILNLHLHHSNGLAQKVHDVYMTRKNLALKKNPLFVSLFSKLLCGNVHEWRRTFFWWFSGPSLPTYHVRQFLIYDILFCGVILDPYLP